MSAKRPRRPAPKNKAASPASERDLETAILREIQQFLLEMSAGFAFVERQKRIVIDGRISIWTCSSSTGGSGGWCWWS